MLEVIVIVIEVIVFTIVALALIAEVVESIISEYNYKKYGSWMGKMNLNGKLYKVLRAIKFGR